MSEPLTEEPLDRYLNRPLARPVVRALVPTPVSANQVTMFAALCGVAGGVAFVCPAPVGRFFGFLPVGAAAVLDCVDGQLARARGGGSPYGYLLDGASDYVIAFSLHAGLMLGSILKPELPLEWRIEAVVGIFLAGLLMAVHSNVFEALKFRYRATLGEHPGQHVKRQEEILASLAEDRGILARFAHAGLTAYHRGQEDLNRQAAEGGPVSRSAFLLSTLLGPTLRLTVLAFSGWAAAWHPRAVMIYPLFALVVGNIVYLILRRRCST
jgi:phosphatidylglycerophosphate synthase